MDKYDKEVSRLVAQARVITSQAEVEGRALRPGERSLVEGLIAQTNELKRKQAVENAAIGGGRPTIAESVQYTGGKSLWEATKAAVGEVEVGQPRRYRLTDSAGTKALMDAGEQDDIMERREGGIEPLVDPSRYVHPVFGTSPGVEFNETTAKVTFLRQDGRTIPLPADVRKPFADTTEKATVESHVTLEEATPEMLGIVAGPYPRAHWNRQDLRALVDADAQRALQDALDDLVVEALLGLAVPVTPEATLIDTILRLKQRVTDAGFSPNTVAVSSNDAFDIMTAKESTTGAYLLGSIPTLGALRVSDFVTDGEPVVFDANVVLDLFRGPLDVLVDPYTGMATNTVSARYEFAALAIPRQADAAARASLTS